MLKVLLHPAGAKEERLKGIINRIEDAQDMPIQKGELFSGMT